MKSLLAICLVVSLFLLCENSAGSDTAWTTLDFPGANWTDVNGVDGNNIVGDYEDTSGTRHGFLYDGLTSWTTLDFPGALGTFAYGISGSKIVGSCSLNNNDNGHGWLCDSLTTWTILEMPDANWTWVTAISGDKIVGFGEFCPNTTLGFIYERGTWTPFIARGAMYMGPNGIDGNIIVGSYGDASENWYGFIYNGTSWTIPNMPGTFRTYPGGISGNNMVGGYYDYAGYDHGFWHNGRIWTTLDFPGASDTWAMGISGRKIVGSYYPVESSRSHGFLYEMPVASAPVISGVQPTSGLISGGTHITVTGTEFMTSATLTIGGNSATNVSVLTSSTITAITPAGKLGPADIVLTNTDASTATLANGFTYVIPKPKPAPAAMLVLY